MKKRTGVLPRDLKHHSTSKMDKEDLKELARTILTAIFMVIAVCFCFLAAAMAPEPNASNLVAEKGGGKHVSSHPVAARRQSNP
ncbi:MAG: hypothetical protein PHF56_01950 [Desulfuromonadaceae bacterium]|nr:hypothetical protein [Desulfuromonadaceae bacterium]